MLIDQLDDAPTWAAYLADKLAAGHLRSRQERELREFVAAEGYLEPVAALRQGEFPLPVKRFVNKSGTAKKRVVYSFPPAHTNVLKLLAQLLYRYDDAQPPGCYSFRRGLGAHTAIRALTSTPGIDARWAYKLDVSDYFNSIEIPRLLGILDGVIDDDPPLLAFLTQILQADQAILDGEVVGEKRGIMAGVPIAPFFANLYLGELDRQHAAIRPYARYSDDIIVFAETEAELDEIRARIGTWLHSVGLSVNPAKESVSAPGEPWEFLGISYCHGQIDLSAATRKKLKGKIRRKARALRRWMLRHDAEPERALKAMIRSFDRKYFTTASRDELNWSRWFFPLLTRDDTLREMDAYLQQYLRWIPTGRHRKRNYQLSYTRLKELGYRTLVHEYHLQVPKTSHRPH
ncbi:MAG: hypothetical protein LBR20_05705 [Propionibacteriaceae bacterium]|jgi:hypothetical protein|nr:hypothetical protein [Propionibacteriaceae bacterium]